MGAAASISSVRLVSTISRLAINRSVTNRREASVGHGDQPCYTIETGTSMMEINHYNCQQGIDSEKGQDNYVPGINSKNKKYFLQVKNSLKTSKDFLQGKNPHKTKEDLSNTNSYQTQEDLQCKRAQIIKEDLLWGNDTENTQGNLQWKVQEKTQKHLFQENNPEEAHKDLSGENPEILQEDLQEHIPEIIQEDLLKGKVPENTLETPKMIHAKMDLEDFQDLGLETTPKKQLIKKCSEYTQENHLPEKSSESAQEGKGPENIYDNQAKGLEDACNEPNKEKCLENAHDSNTSSEEKHEVYFQGKTLEDNTGKHRTIDIQDTEISLKKAENKIKGLEYQLVGFKDVNLELRAHVAFLEGQLQELQIKPSPITLYSKSIESKNQHTQMLEAEEKQSHEELEALKLKQGRNEKTARKKLSDAVQAASMTVVVSEDKIKCFDGASQTSGENLYQEKSSHGDDDNIFDDKKYSFIVELSTQVSFQQNKITGLENTMEDSERRIQDLVKNIHVSLTNKDETDWEFLTQEDRMINFSHCPSSPNALREGIHSQRVSSADPDYSRSQMESSQPVNPNLLLINELSQDSHVVSEPVDMDIYNLYVGLIQAGIADELHEILQTCNKVAI